MEKSEQLKQYLNERKNYQIQSNARAEVEVLKKIKDLAKDIYGEESNEYIYYLNELGGSSKYIGEYEQGIKSLNLAKEIILKKEGNNSISYATCLLNLTEVYRFMQDLDKLEPLYLEVIKIYDNNNIQNEYVYAGVCNNLALYYQNIEQAEKAIPYHEKSLAILKNMEDHIVEYATTLNNLVMPYYSLGEKEKALNYLNEALSIYLEKVGPHHSMYSAALNNLGLIKFQEKDYIASFNVLSEALEITKNSFGENSLNYTNLKSNLDYIESFIDNNLGEEYSNLKIKEISSIYTKEYILPLLEKKLPEILDKVSIALIGEGSEVLGYEDNYSKDHDYTFMPTILLNRENYEKYREKLEDILLSLPRKFAKISHTNTEAIKERKGLKCYEDYLYKYFGKEDINLNILDYRNIPEYVFGYFANASIYYDGDNKLTNLVSSINYYPEVIRQNKIARVCTQIAQSGQYNYLRLMKRNDIVGASIAKNIFIENTIHLIYLLNKKYMPIYKWYTKGMQDFEILKNLLDRIEKLLDSSLDMHKCSNMIEEICYYLVEELKKQKLSNVRGYFLTNHAIYIQQNIDDNYLKTISPFEE